MMIRRRQGRLGITLVALALAVAGSAAAVHAGAHTWRVSEAFSNADGSIWFVELWEYNGGDVEVAIEGAFIVSVNTGNSIDIASNIITGGTANRFVLFANQAFADLPGAPVPDQIVGGNAFFSFAAGERLRYTFSGSPFDLVLPAAGLPTDGILSFNLGTGAATNSPTNYAGDTGTVDASGGGGSGEVGLTLSKIVGPTVDVVLSWGASCEDSDTAYGVYRGTLASVRTGLYDHAAMLCGLAATTTTFPSSAVDEYYLVVPAGTDTEGSYGRSLIGGGTTERPPGAGACEAQTISCP